MNKMTNRENIYNQNSPFPVKKNGFDLTHKVISSWDMGKLYPFPPHEVYPNDSEKTKLQWKMILETLKKPIYNNIDIKFREYFTAYRILWKHWRNYYTGGRKGDFDANLPKVNINCKSNVKGSIFDYLGFPIAFDYKFDKGKLYMKRTAQSEYWGDAPVYVSAFPFIAYDFVYFWNFINSEIQENIVYDIQDNLVHYLSKDDVTIEDENKLFRYYALDFYLMNGGTPTYTRLLSSFLSTDAIPPSNVAIEVSNISELGINDRYSFFGRYHKSGTSYSVGLITAQNSGNADANGYYLQKFTALNHQLLNNKALLSDRESLELVNIGFLYNVNWQRDYYTSAHLNRQMGDPVGFPIGGNIKFNIPENTIVAVNNQNGEITDGGLLTDALNRYNELLSSSFFPNDLRLVFATSMIKEGALMSTKAFEYSSYLQFFFGSSPSSRDLQQPVYTGGISSNFYTQEVVQNSGSTGDNSLGDYAGKGSSLDDGYLGSYNFDEIGLSIMVMFIAPSDVYQSSQGINRQWLRDDRFDFYNPAFSHIGFQDIQKQELYVSGKSSDTEPFGYTMCFNELRYLPDVVTSDMRDTLDVWHQARKYSQQPVLNSTYLLCRPSKRIFDVMDIDTPVITGIVNVIKISYRDMPELGIPELLDHRY